MVKGVMVKAMDCGIVVNSYTSHAITFTFGGARDVMVIVVGNGHGDTSSKSRTRLIAFPIVLIPLERYESNYSPSSYG